MRDSTDAPDAATVTIVVIDDHPLMRDALALAAVQAAPLARVRAFGSTSAALAAEPQPDLVLLDLDLGDGGDLASLMSLLRVAPGGRVAIVSATDRAEVMRRARALGACGYLRKSASLPEMCAAITALLAGEDVFCADVLDPAEPIADDAASKLNTLTPTQGRVLAGLREGRLNKQIAHDLSISEATVKAHVTAIFRKLGVQNRSQAILAAQALDV